MTDTLFNVVLAVGRLMGGMAYGTATGGSTTTIIDTTRIEDDDFWNRGTALIVTDAGGASAAPEGEWGLISDWVESTTTATIATLTAAVAAGDTYALIPPRWSLEKLLNKINLVLMSIKIGKVDITSLDTADNQTIYDLPTGIPAHNLRRVWVERVDDANDPQWYEIRDWRVYVTATGSADKLEIPQLDSGWDIRLDYVAPHGVLSAATDEIDESIHISRIIYQAAELLTVEEIGAGESYRNITSLANYYRDLAKEAESMHPVATPPLNSRIKTYLVSTDGAYTGEVGSVRL